MTNGVLVVRFYNGAAQCGYSANNMDLLPADQTVTVDLSSIWLSGGGLPLPCKLPVRTTSMEVELWSDASSWTNTLKVAGLPGGYTFVDR
jgi:hypothetical protein